MKLLNGSGTVTARLDASTQNIQLLSTEDKINPLISGLDDYKVGIIFAIVDLRLQVLLEKFERAIIPVIKAEDSSATRVEQTNSSELASARLGIEFAVNGKPIVRKRIVNYGKTNTIPLLSKIAGTAKYLGRGDVLSAYLINLGSGLITDDDYIDITCDYLIDLSGFKINDDLLVRFEGE